MKGLTALIISFFSVGGTAFAPSTAFTKTTNVVRIEGSSLSPFGQTDTVLIAAIDTQPASLRRQRRSVANISTMSLFGLGGPELAIILIAAAFLLGPEKLAELGKDAGKIAGELKEVPKEFQAGMAEGEAEAKEMMKVDSKPKPATPVENAVKEEEPKL
mmetsp:Transcript_38283/g.44594  ORF Transcript_38283/g.44594 Transcript_38283/m.44594 type:complete len:159 (+) Transcript_38283:75-551(+)|eukprot:CAMPEP_0194378792 /NCGR_PEP_ID=MMETSP0174-20130528/37093_1 /TAXON_ID=216777 /ORGANISM="Proboscia alata, Strain PI-D3" /LENGTH=158 /DNA_ID=CAMNT_0039161067 /DNA_START=14 /DNA_END=490 /DNA_ORIENTATION=+